MRQRALVVLWLILGVLIWNAFFDLYVSRGAREFLQEQAEFQLHIGSRPELDEVLGRAQHQGLIWASVWTGSVVGLGLATLGLTKRLK